MGHPVRITIVLQSLSLASMCGSSAAAALLFDQFGGVAATNGAWTSQIDTSFPLDSQLADDFSLSATDTVRKIRFWGGYFNGTPAPVTSFNVRVYADAGGVPTGTPSDPSGTALHAFSVSATVVDTGATSSGMTSDILQYDVDLGAGFLATAGVTYWLAIQADISFPPQWGWTTQVAGAGNSAQLWVPVLGFNTWTSITDHTQFQLFSGTGGAVPLPGAAALAALGFAGVSRRTRR